MKKLLLLIAFIICLSTVAQAQGDPPLRVREVDGSPGRTNPTQLRFPNGTLTISGSIVTYTPAGGGGLTIGTTTITSGTDTRVLFNNAGVVGEYSITGTGNAVLSASPTLTGTIGAAAATFSGTIVQTSASAAAFESGLNGSTNPVFRLVNNVASQATGISITGRAATAGVDITVLSSGTDENLRLQPKGSGRVIVGTSGGNTPLQVFGSTGPNSIELNDGIYENTRSTGYFNFNNPNNSYDFFAGKFTLNGSTRILNYNEGTFAATATSPAQLTGNVNDYNPGGTSYLQRWSSDASRNVTSLTFTAAQVAGQTHCICNVGAQPIVLTHDDGATGTAANRFKFTGGTNVTIAADDCVIIAYDATTQRWRRAQ